MVQFSVNGSALSNCNPELAELLLFIQALKAIEPVCIKHQTNRD